MPFLVITAVIVMFLYHFETMTHKERALTGRLSARLVFFGNLYYTAKLGLNFHTRAHNVTNFDTQQLGPVS